jgi:hypothetical protein
MATPATALVAATLAQPRLVLDQCQATVSDQMRSTYLAPVRPRASPTAPPPALVPHARPRWTQVALPRAHELVLGSPDPSCAGPDLGAGHAGPSQPCSPSPMVCTGRGMTDDAML